MNDDADKDDGNACTNDQCSGGTASHTGVVAGKTCNQGGGVQCDGVGTCGPAIVKINEVESNNPDYFELYNTSGTASVDLSGWVMKDNKDMDDSNSRHVYTFPAGTVITPHGFLAFDSATFMVGLGSDDMVRIFAPDGTTLIDSFHWTNHPTTSWARCPDGTGDFKDGATSSEGVANSCP